MGDSNVVSSAASHRPIRYLIIGASTVLAIGCICCGIVIGLVGVGGYRSLAERDDVEAVLDQFMVAMADQDTNRAFESISTRGQRHITLVSLEDWLEGNNFAVFEGYQDLSVLNITLGAYAATDPNRPRGPVATVSGTIRYDDGTTGRFTAVLEDEDGEWRIFGIEIIVPPEKFGA